MRSCSGFQTSVFQIDNGGFDRDRDWELCRVLSKVSRLAERAFPQPNRSSSKIIVTQCKLSGVNPLSQEMAAGALIGKRPRDLISPKAVKYMQEVFSIKDAFSKKESGEISVQFGATLTQVQDFFASQCTRVRKLIRLSREKAIRVNAHKECQNGVLTTSDALLAID